MPREKSKIDIRRAGWIPTVGDIIDDRYRIDEVVAQGGMGVVLRAEHLSLGRPVVVKVLRPKWSTDEAMAKRFEREVRVAKDFSHPHIVRTYDSGTTPEGCLYLVMEWLEGQDLSELLGEEGRLDIDRAMRIWKQILDALAEAHSLGIMHRDLKPANVFVTHDRHGRDHVKLLDFGIAKPVESEEEVTKAGQICGTVAYMAPEVILEAGGGKPADVYAAALLFLEITTGQQVIEDSSAVDALYQHLKVEIPLPRVLATRAIGEVLKKALAKHPDRRFPDADALLMAVERASSDLPTDLVIPPPSKPLMTQGPDESLGGFLNKIKGQGLNFLEPSGSRNSSDLVTRPTTSPRRSPSTIHLSDDDLEVVEEIAPDAAEATSKMSFEGDDTVVMKPRPDEKGKFPVLLDDGRLTRIYDPAANKASSTAETSVTAVARPAALAPGQSKPRDIASKSPSTRRLGSGTSSPDEATKSLKMASPKVIGAIVIACALVAIPLFLLVSSSSDDLDDPPLDANGELSASDEGESAPVDEPEISEEHTEDERADTIVAVEREPQPPPAGAEDTEEKSDESTSDDAPVQDEESTADEAQTTEEVDDTDDNSVAAPEPRPSPPPPRPEPTPRPEPEPQQEEAADPDDILDRYFQD